jgi:hypothetical protein
MFFLECKKKITNHRKKLQITGKNYKLRITNYGACAVSATTNTHGTRHVELKIENEIMYRMNYFIGLAGLAIMRRFAVGAGLAPALKDFSHD